MVYDQKSFWLDGMCVCLCFPWHLLDNVHDRDTLADKPAAPPPASSSELDPTASLRPAFSAVKLSDAVIAPRASPVPATAAVSAPAPSPPRPVLPAITFEVLRSALPMLMEVFTIHD